jgi:hypothetical protein
MQGGAAAKDAVATLEPSVPLLSRRQVALGATASPDNSRSSAPPPRRTEGGPIFVVLFSRPHETFFIFQWFCPKPDVNLEG